MKLESKTSIFNMGDTSIRVKQIVDVNKVILRQLNNFMETIESWGGNNTAQEEFYHSFIKEIVRIEEEEGVELFRDFARERNYTSPKTGKVGLRGRTLTNQLIKIGFIDSNRNLSEVGKHYINDELLPADGIEQVLGLCTDNLAYLRQCLKLRIYSSDSSSDSYFYNFRFALKFLAKYDNVPQDDFLKIIESVKPEQSKAEIFKIIDDYENVSKNRYSFEQYYKNTFSPTLRTQQELDEVRSMFTNKDFKDDNFIRYFPNRDSNKTSLLYKEFVLSLIDLVENHSPEAFETVKLLSKDSKIKKAFSENKLPFIFTRNETLEHFLQQNKGNPLLNDDHYYIYLEFIFSKHNDLIREYKDMCRRIFKITGLISFDNGLVNLNNKWIIKPLLEMLGDSFIINGTESYKEYETTLESKWFKDNTTSEILGISSDMIDELLKNIGIQFGVTDITSIPQVINNKREQEYRDFVESHFPREKIINILESINSRKDDEVYKLVTDNATISTIYEYILTMAWYHISDKKNFLLHKSFQVALDGNKLPLTHRGGGAGDIEIITDDYALLIEATLMDKNTQKRGELEPVIRHSINFSLQQKVDKKQVQSIFIANELDNNVLNLFRATQFIQFSGTTETGNINGLNIFALTTKEIIKLLNENKNDRDILNTINDNLNSNPINIENNWRIPIVNKIFA